MKLTILQVGQTPPAMQKRFSRYPPQFQTMLDAAGGEFSYETVWVLDGQEIPDSKDMEGVIITGSAAGVYEDHPWMEPLRETVRRAYASAIPMLGVCFGHQIMAEALGGEVRKSEKGWGLGRVVYNIKARPAFLDSLPDSLAIAASHQDQVITPPGEADVFLTSDFTPNAGLFYRNGAAVSVQPHPEFDKDYSQALIDLRRGNPLEEGQADAASRTLDAPLDSAQFARSLVKFFKSHKEAK